MPAATVLLEGPLRVFDYRCGAGPHDRPFTEQHAGYSLAYVRRGSFGYRTRGCRYELVAGAFLVGRAGDEFLCTHEHHAHGDECLSFSFDAECLEETGLDARGWVSHALPPLPELALLGERAQASAHSHDALALEEAGTLLAARYLALQGRTALTTTRLSVRERRRAVRGALWLEAHAAERVRLAQVARASGVSAFHFLRLFRRVIGVTPHQYLVRTRLRRAARLLAAETQPVADIAYQVGFGDLSNFVRTFRRAAGVSPRAFRAAGRADRKILQARLRGRL